MLMVANLQKVSKKIHRQISIKLRPKVFAKIKFALKLRKRQNNLVMTQIVRTMKMSKDHNNLKYLRNKWIIFTASVKVPPQTQT